MRFDIEGQSRGIIIKKKYIYMDSHSFSRIEIFDLSLSLSYRIVFVIFGTIRLY